MAQKNDPKNNKIDHYLHSTEEEKKKKLKKIYGEWKVPKRRGKNKENKLKNGQLNS